MRKLYVTRGIPGSGKSTLLEACGLGPYVLSPDALRLAMSAPVLDETGKISITAAHDKQVWQLLYELLEERMARGEVIAIDATHTTARYYNEYTQLAYRHRYKMFIIDLSDVSLDEAHRRNEAREEYKVVKPAALNDMHARLEHLPYPKGWQVLGTVDEVRATLAHPVLDFSDYKTVHHIGDIQGCFAPLAEYFTRNPLREDEAYVFVGDFLDRGPENDRVLDYISREFTDKPNVYFVEGNHDLYIWQWLHNWPVKTREFNGRTRRQLEAAPLDKRAISALLRAMVPALHYHYHGREVLVTHGGLSTLPKNLGAISAVQCIRGVGAYEQVGDIDDAFVQNTADNVYQIHGHRNRQNYSLHYNERCFNLEGKVEFGGALRTVQLTRNGFQSQEIPNAIVTLAKSDAWSENAKLVQDLRNNRLISERTLPENISSFHYRPEVMFKKKWSKQTTTTRGLFINTLSNEIVARAYDKFFNINENRQTDYASLERNLAFPVTAWVKENGYLGLVGYDSTAGDLVFASKTTTEGEFATWFRELFEARFLQTTSKRQQLIDYLESRNTTLVCEVLLPDRDPHIIQYPRDEIVGLELIKRQKDYETLPQTELAYLAGALGMRTKKQATTLADWSAFVAWYSGVQGIDYLQDGHAIEGFVIEDSKGWNVKIKLDYYTFWKQLRSALDALKKGKEPKISAHCPHPEEAQKVVAYMQRIAPDRLAAIHIIDIRKMYLADRS